MQIFRRRLQFLSLFSTLSVLLVLTWAYCRGGDIYAYKDTVGIGELPPIDAIVCLAGGRGRILAAGDFWYQYWQKQTEGVPLPILYFSGVDAQVTWPNLSRQLRGRVAEVLKPEQVVLEKVSNNTAENALFLARHVQGRQWRRIMLLTSSYHMKRASFIFNEMFKKGGQSDRDIDHVLTIESYSVFQEPFTARSWRKEWNGVRVTLIEYFKWIYYRFVWARM